MLEQDQFRLLQDFLMKEEKISQFYCEEDRINIAQIAPLLKIGAVEFEEIPSAGSRMNGRQSKTISYYENNPDREQEPVKWSRETYMGSTICFRTWPEKNESWDESERYMVEKGITGFAIIKKSVYLKDGFLYVNFHDAELDSKNLRYGIFKITKLMEDGKIGDYAVFFMNVRGTGEMNNQIGREYGTIVLREFLKKMNNVLEEPEAVWRVGGDNLGAVIRKENLDHFLNIIQGAVIPYGPGCNDNYRISATAGICPGDEHFKKTSELIDAAQACMNLARYERHIPYLFYDRQIVSILKNTKHVEMAFSDALKNEEFQVYYQPKVSLQTNEVVGAEALCRWIRNGEVVPPKAFIPILERSKRICELDFYMLEHTCQDLHDWIENSGTPVEISVNFSRKHLSNPYLAKRIVEILNQYDIPHEIIIVELTETTSTAHLKQMSELVYRLKDEGVRTSVDDFGMGYSSMSMLRDIPFSELKIDRSFLTYTTDTRDRSAVMMKHVISMANELGMRCIAEGVETRDQIRMLKEMECLRAQGFYFDQPLPRAAFEKRLKMGGYKEKPIP